MIITYNFFLIKFVIKYKKYIVVNKILNIFKQKIIIYIFIDKNIDNYRYIGISILRIYRIYHRYFGKKFR